MRKLEALRGRRREKASKEKCEKQMKASLQLLELLKSVVLVSHTADKCKYIVKFMHKLYIYS